MKKEELIFLKHTLDWNQLVKSFDWVANLKDCPQDAIYHAEGDVLIHTKMVIESLFELEDFKKLSSEEKGILFAACLLHDVGKPATTVIEENGRISSAGHAKLGEKMSRQILADCMIPNQIKEEVCKLVRLHGLPLWFLEKQDPQKAVIQASLQCNMHWLAMVAEADVKGRICADQEELILKVNLFREFCLENDCYGNPKKFASDHSRFLYFNKENYHPDYEAFDDTRSKVYLMCGLPGSGKNTWINANFPNLPVVSLDDIREELGISFKDNQGRVLQLAEERAKGYLRKNISFVWNATNLVKQRRKKLVDLFSLYKAKVYIVYIATPLQNALAQNAKREEPVKENVIYNFFGRMEPPDISECHELIILD